MDSEIIQFIIQEIIDTDEYTLEGIAYALHIPFDIVYEAACGINKQLSISSCAKIIDLYLQVKPDIREYLICKLQELNEKNRMAFSLVLNEA